MKITPIAAILAIALCGAAQAQDKAVDVVQRDANLQQRIERGLASGQLSTQEAGRLERLLQRVERNQADALRRGVTPREQSRIAMQQDRISRVIARARHDRRESNPDMRSAQRLQEGVRHSANQQERIARGLQSGDLSNAEAARLEAGQARVSAELAMAAADGRVSGAEQQRIRNLQQRQNQRVYARRHNDRDRYDRRY